MNTASEEEVAPAIASTGFPAATGSAAFQPRNAETKLSSATVEPMPVVWVEASTLRFKIEPAASKLTKRVTWLPLYPAAEACTAMVPSGAVTAPITPSVVSPSWVTRDAASVPAGSTPR